MKSGRYALFIIASIIISGILACSTNKENPETVNVGAILPLTGNSSFIGEWTKNGIDLAFTEKINKEEINKSEKHKNIGVVYGDSKADPKEGVAILNNFISIYKVPVAICAITSVTNALKPIADARKVILFATAVSAAGITEESRYTFRLFITADIDAKTMASYAAQKLNAKRVGILFVNDDMGVSFSKVFKKTFLELGGTIPFEESFNVGTTDFRSIAARIKKIQADAIYILGYDNNLAIIPRQLRESGIKATFLSVGTIGQANVLRQAKEALDGTYFTTTAFSADNPQTEGAKRFVELYEKKFGNLPNYFSAFSYDVMSLIIEAISVAGNDVEEIRNILLNTRDFNGVSGKISIKPNGDADFPMVVKVIRNGRIEDAD